MVPLLAKFGVKGYAVLIVGGLILGVIHHIVNLNRGKDPYKLIVFETINQKSELRAKPNGLELFLYDFNDNTNQGSKWTIPANQLQDILDRGNIFIRRSRSQSERGLFDLGGYTDWYYSTNLFKNPGNLQKELEKLIRLAISLSPKVK